MTTEQLRWEMGKEEYEEMMEARWKRMEQDVD